MAGHLEKLNFSNHTHIIIRVVAISDTAHRNSSGFPTGSTQIRSTQTRSTQIQSKPIEVAT
jgi:hypothetical protein